MLLRSEFYRAFHRKSTYVSFLFLIALQVIGFYNSLMINGLIPLHEYNSWYLFLKTIGLNMNSIWAVCLPIAVALPLGDSLVMDIKSGFDVPLVLRVGVRHYFLWKWISNALVTAIVMGAANVSGLVIALIWRHDIQIPTIVYHYIYGPKAFTVVFGSGYVPAVLGHLFLTDPLLYCLLTIGITMLIASALSGIAVSTTLWVKYRYLVLATPIIFYYLFSIFPQFFVGGWQWTTFILSTAFWQFTRPFWQIPVYWLAMLVLSFLMMAFGPRRYRKMMFSYHGHE